MSEQFLFRGCDKLYYGSTTESVVDGVLTLTFGVPKQLAAVKEVGQTTSSDSAVQFGDNKALVITNSEGADELTFSVFGIAPDVLAELTGKYFDSAKGMYVNRQRDFGYHYVMWREKLTNGAYRYCIAYKCTIAVPDHTSATEDDGTDANGQDITVTSIFTEKEFSDGKASKGYFLDTNYTTVDASAFFTEVKDQDTVGTAQRLVTITTSGDAVVSVTDASDNQIQNGNRVAVGTVLTISVTGGTLAVNGSAFTSGQTYTVATENVNIVGTGE